MNTINQTSFLLIAWLAALVMNCQGQTATQHLNPENFQAKLSSMSEKTILDVRTHKEYSSGHLKDAVCMDYYNDDFKQKVDQLDRSKPVFVYCAAGSRSESAGKILAQMGFKEIYNLKGGINAWIKDNQPIEK
jgi:rhodanese-related sulfurtransferase